MIFIIFKNLIFKLNIKYITLLVNKYKPNKIFLYAGFALPLLQQLRRVFNKKIKKGSEAVGARLKINVK
jgi:hypothetical protein